MRESMWDEALRFNSDFMFLLLYRSRWQGVRMSNSSNYTNSSVPFSVGSPFIAVQYLVTWCIVYLIIAAFAICGNVLIIFVFSKKRHLRTRTNYFVIGLAFGDILVGTVTIPLYATLLILLFKESSISM